MYARRYESPGAATARIEVIDPTTWNWISVADREITSRTSWAKVSTSFVQTGVRTVVLRLTLIGRSDSPQQDIAIDDVSVSCREIFS
jgi:hypothetical protein